MVLSFNVFFFQAFQELLNVTATANCSTFHVSIKSIKVNPPYAVLSFFGVIDFNQLGICCLVFEFDFVPDNGN